MRDWGARAAFTIGGRDYTWDDVWVHARVSGSWNTLETAVREGILLRDAGNEAPADQVRADAVAFRRARRLDAAEDAEAWLAARDLSVPQLFDHLEREVLRRLYTAPRRRRSVADRPEVFASGWCSGAFDDMARSLAAAELGVGEWEPSDKEVKALIERRKLDWIACEADVAVFRNEDAAREALHCVKSDGMALAEVATLAKSEARRWSGMLEDLESGVRTRLLAAAEGDLVGPVPFDGGPAVVLVHRKVLPSPASAAAVARARQVLRDSTVERTLTDRVVFHEPGT